MKEEVKQRMMQQIELALLKLNHVPYIVSKKQKMAIWSDIREILFMKCVGQKCSVVLSALKSHLRYPASERFMHPCSPSEQLQFMKKYIVVSPGTLLVDLNLIGDRFELMKLYDMVKIKHDMSGDETIRKCKELSEKKRIDKNIQHLLENPLRNLTKKIFLPSIQRRNSKGHSEEKDGRLIKSVLYNSFGEEASTALIPMYLLKETYPASVCVLEEAVRLYIIGQSGQAKLASVCQCTREEGYHFSRFMAMQFGFEKQWPCLTSSSLLISWEEFWLTNGRNNDVNLVPNINVSVVTLNCQVKEKLEQKAGHIASKANLKEPCNSTAQKVKGKKSSEKETCNFKESDINSFTFQSMKENRVNPGEKPISLTHEESKVRLPRPVSDSLKKSKSLTSSIITQAKKKINIPRKSNSNNALPAISAVKFLSNIKDSRDDNVGLQVQDDVQTNIRVTRSKSHNAVSKNNLISIKNKNGKINVSTLEPSTVNCQRKIEGIDPDENNSAVHDVDNNKKTVENASVNPVEQVYKKTESGQNITISQESISNIQTAFDIRSIEVSITPKKKHNENEEGEDLEENVAKIYDVDDRKSPGKRLNERKNLKIPSAKFSDQIPDLLRVDKRQGNSDHISLKDKQIASPKGKTGHNTLIAIHKGIAVHDLERRRNSLDYVEPKEGKILTKSLELNVTSPKPKVKGKEFHTHKIRAVKHTMNKGSTIDNDLYPVVNGVKLQNSPTNGKDRPACKSAGTLPGPLNTIPNKAKSASHERTGKLPNEIVSNLKQQATNSICSVLGNSDKNTLKEIVASGKEIISPRKSVTKSGADSSDFQSERITMWRDRLEENKRSPKSGRICKSADIFSRKGRPYTYRPTSSIYNPSYSEQKAVNGPSIKTGLCVLMSRERNKSPKVSSIRNTYQMTKRDSPSPKKSKESKSPPKDKVDVPNYGSSSSKTPDIYDEFARKKKNTRLSKPDLQLVKGKKMSCEHKYSQNLQLNKAKSCDSKTKPSENIYDSISTKKYDQNPSQKGVTFQQYENRANNETRNLPLTSNMYRILDANLTKRNSLYQCSQGQVGNACNSNQYSTCSMCWHESNMITDTEIGQSFSNLNSTDFKSISSFSDVPLFEAKGLKTFEDCNDVITNNTNSYHTFCASKESLLERIKSIEDNVQQEKDIVSSPDEEQVHVDIGDTDANKHIKLLDKMNMFVDGTCNPQQCDSLENIENIKNIIKINPIQSQNQHSFELDCSEGLYESLSNFVESGIAKLDSLDNNVAKTEAILSYISSDICDDQAFITDNELEVSNPEVSVHVSKADSHGQFDSMEEKDYIDKNIENNDFVKRLDQTNVNDRDWNIKKATQKANKVSEPLNSQEIHCKKDMIDSYSVDDSDSIKELSEEFEKQLEGFQENTKDKSINKIVKTRNSKRQAKNKTVRNKSKSFKEVVEEKRASKKKAELELAKKKFWKSAASGALNEPQTCAPKITHKKKTIIKTLSEDNTGIHMAHKLSVKTDKKKRPQTCPIYSVNTCGTDSISSISKNNISKGKEKKTKTSTYIEYKETDGDYEVGKIFMNEKSNKYMQKRELDKSLEETEEKADNRRILRTQAMRSAKNNKSFRKKKRNSLKNMTETDEVLRAENKHENSANTAEPCRSKKFQARQRKLRLKVHNKCSPKGANTCKQNVEDVNIQSFESGLEQVDDSKVICETVQFENIVELVEKQSGDDIEDSPTRTFITQLNEHPFQQEINSLDLDNSLPFEEMPSIQHPSSFETYTEFNNKDGFESCNKYDVPESVKSKQTDCHLSVRKDSLISTENILNKESEVNWNDLYETKGVKNIDLSELPESVLEVVLSDNLINMTTFLDSDQVEFEETNLSAMDKEEDNSRILGDDIPGTRETELYVESGNVVHMHVAYTDDVLENNREACYAGEEPFYQFNDLNTFSKQQHQEHTDDVSQNAITVLHPNGGKLYLTENHPAYEIFSNVFVQQNLNPSVVDRNDLIALPDGMREDLRNAAMISEDKNQIDSQGKGQDIWENLVDSNEIVENSCGNNIENDYLDGLSKEAKQCTERCSNRDMIINEKISKCFVKLNKIKERPIVKKSAKYTHSDNIFDALRLELDKMTQNTNSDLPESLPTEMNTKDRNIDETDTDDADFEKDIMEMMGESFEMKLSDREDNVISCKIPSNRCHQIYSASLEEGSNHEELLNSHTVHQTERSPLYGNDCLTNACNDTCRTDMNLCCNQDKSSEGTEQTYVSDVDKNNSVSHNVDNNMPILSEIQPPQEIIRSVALGLRENKLDKQKVMNSGADHQSDTSNCESPETCKYGDDSFSDLSCSDFVPHSSDETSGNEYESNSDESEFIGRSSCDMEHGETHKKTGTKCKTTSCDTKRLKSRKMKKCHVDEKSNASKSPDKKENMKNKFKRGRKQNLKRKSSSFAKKEEEDEVDKDAHEDTVSVNSLVTTQRLYLDILKNSTGKTVGETAETDNRYTENLVDILREGFMLKRDRDLSRLEAEEERMKEGTGSLADLEKEDCGNTIVNDPTTNCRYQVVEDEDGITLGGVVYYNEYVLPFVYINGYKYTPLKDAATLFQPDCCAWKCRIPKNVMRKDKRLFKTFSTWEQVYKLELIKMKKGPPIKTGDVLVKFDSFVSLLPALLLEIIAQHKNSKLKYSQDCDMKSYLALQGKIK